MTSNGFPIAEEVVEIPGGKVVARGLSLSDLTWLSQHYGPALGEMFSRFRQGVQDGDDFLKFATVAEELLVQGPELAAAIIAAGCGMRDHVASAAGLGLGTQIDLLVKIGNFTFAQEGGAKKVFETVFRMASTVNQITADLNT